MKKLLLILPLLAFCLSAQVQLNNARLSKFQVTGLNISAPVNTTRPSVDNNAPSGTGITLTATPGSYSNAVTSYIRQWKRQGTNIADATNLTYVTAAADQGLGLSFYEKAINAAGDSGFVRAGTGLPRPFFISGDSLFAGSLFNSGTFTPLIQSALGTNWSVVNVAVSGQNIYQMEITAQSLVDPFINKGWGVSFYQEYANQVTGIQGTNDGVTTAGLISTFGLSRSTNGAGAVITSTAYYRTQMEHGKDGTEAHVASEIVRTNFVTFSSGFIDLDYTPFYQSATNNDGVHWNLDSADTTTLIGLFTNKMAIVGLVGGCGDIPVPNAPTTVNLRTYSIPQYVYDPVNPLPASVPFNPGSNCYLHVTSGSGWDLGSFLVNGLIDSFPTVDGNQRLYNTSPAQSTGGLSGGHYFFDPNP